MTIAVVTSCSAKGWQEYGRRFVETYQRHWPADVPLFLVSEDELSDVPKGVTRLHLGLSEPAAKFMARFADDRRAKGLVQHPTDHGWTPKKIREGYNFRYDAFRFAKKVFAIEMVARSWREKGGRLYWCDADVVTFADVPREMLIRLLPDDKALCCLDRGNYHSECGFVGYNLDHPRGPAFIRAFAALYESDHVFQLQEWHDSWVFDWLRRKLSVPTHAIPHASRSHPFVNSELGKYMDHLKGERKAGGTPRRELVTNLDVPYWQGRIA